MAVRRFTSGRAPRRLAKAEPVLGTPISSPAWATGANVHVQSAALANIDQLKHERNVENHADDPEFLLALKMAQKAAELIHAVGPQKIDDLSRCIRVDSQQQPTQDPEPPSTAPPRPPRRLTGVPPPPPPLSARGSSRTPTSNASSGGAATTPVLAAPMESADLPPPAQVGGATATKVARADVHRAAVDWLSSAYDEAASADDKWDVNSLQHSGAENLDPSRRYVPPSRRPRSWSRGHGLPRLSRAVRGGDGTVFNVAVAGAPQLPRPLRRLRSSWSRRDSSAPQPVPEHEPLASPPPPPPRRSRPQPSCDQTSSSTSSALSGEDARDEMLRRVPSNVMLDLLLPPPGMPPPPPPRKNRQRETEHWL